MQTLDKKFLAELLARAFALLLSGVLAKLGYDAVQQTEILTALGYVAAAGLVSLFTVAWAALERRYSITKALLTPPPSDGGAK